MRVEIPVIERIAALKLLEPREPLKDLIGMETLCELSTAEAVAMAGMRTSARSLISGDTGAASST